MSQFSPPAGQATSTRPYLIRALHDWCTDNGFTPYLAVHVDAQVRVPMEYVKNNEIVLNCGFEATSGLKLGNEFVEFKARFGGVPREIVVPVDHVVAIYARENGQGMAFPMPVQQEVTQPPRQESNPDQRSPITAEPVQLRRVTSGAPLTPGTAHIAAAPGSASPVRPLRLAGVETAQPGGSAVAPDGQSGHNTPGETSRETAPDTAHAATVRPVADSDPAPDPKPPSPSHPKPALKRVK